MPPIHPLPIPRPAQTARRKDKIAKGKEYIWLDFHFVGSDSDLIAGRSNALWWQHILSIGEYDLKSVKSMVEKIREVCDKRATDKRRPKIYDLTIDAHGNKFMIDWGKDQVTGKSVGKFKEDLKKINEYFDPAISEVRIVSCETGNALSLLGKLSEIGNNTPVIGFTQSQAPTVGTPKGTGPQTRCVGRQCKIIAEAAAN